MTIQAGVHEKGTLSFSDLVRDLKEKRDLTKAGAIVSFVGVVRGQTFKGEQVQKLEVEAYEEKANEVLANICRDLKGREGVMDVQIHHLLGEFSVGEELVYVLVAGQHRKDVFPVLEEAVDRFKKEAPIFKKEYIINEQGDRSSYWVTGHQK